MAPTEEMAGLHRQQRRTAASRGDRGEVAAAEQRGWPAAASRWQNKGLAAATSLPLWFVVVVAAGCSWAGRRGGDGGAEGHASRAGRWRRAVALLSCSARAAWEWEEERTMVSSLFRAGQAAGRVGSGLGIVAMQREEKGRRRRLGLGFVGFRK
ncbi:unnamed protein product [Linum trigynum]|uniref:Uncharacterized protein n=1 Tax=Linum trigynum TaxID=586398 RepID=A0AAV2D7A8_9ROSI